MQPPEKPNIDNWDIWSSQMIQHLEEGDKTMNNKEKIMEKEIDMSKYTPYKNFAGLCKFKSLNERQMSWQKFDKKILGDAYLIRPIKKEEIGIVVELYRMGFPELYGNYKHGKVLYQDSLLELLDSKKGFLEGDWFLVVIEKIDEKKLIGSGLIRMDPGNMSVQWELAVIHPEYRGIKGLFRSLLQYFDEISEKSGAEYGSLIAATFQPKTQKVLQDLGWNIRGFFPGLLLAWNHEDKYYRRSMVAYDKFYNKGEELVPDEMELIPEVEQFLLTCIKRWK